MSSDYGHEQRAAALSLPEAELRRRVDVLLEQCGRELMSRPYLRGLPTVDAPFLYVSEILMLLGVGPTTRQAAVEALKNVLPESERIVEAALHCTCSPYDSLHQAGCSLYGIRPHLPMTPEQDERRQQFEAMFHSYCTDGTCGTCGACELRAEGF